MTTIISGSSPSITFSDSTTQTTAFTSTPSVTSITTSADASISGLTVGKGLGSIASNTAIGNTALGTNTSGAHNVAVGYNASPQSNAGSYNVAVGENTLFSNITGSYNTALGIYALQNTTASNNTAVGYQAGASVTTGTDNTFIGLLAGAVSTLTTTGAANTYIGSNSRGSAAGNNREIVIGFDVAGQGTNTVTLGSNVGKIYNSFTVNATWTQTSDVRMKSNIQNDSLGLSFINRLRPVKFTWKPANELDQDNPYYSEENKRDTTTVIHGLIAQEVKAALDAEGVDTFAGWDMGADGIQAISREMFISPLIKAIQEQQALIESLKARLDAANL